ITQPFDDGETQPKAQAAVAGRIVELMKLLENLPGLVHGKADAGVEHLDADDSRPPPASKQQFPAARVLEGVRDQIADHLIEETRVASSEETAWDDAPPQALFSGEKREVGLHAAE